MSDFSASEVAMKRFLSLMLCLCLILTLTACGEKRGNNSTGSGSSSDSSAGSNSGSTDGTMENGDAETRIRMGSGNNIFGANDSSLRSQVYGAKNGSSNTAKGNSAMSDANSSNFSAMLRNGRVHDRDGDLTDGENALHGSYGKRVAQ